jgi:hypothetical protein
MEEAGGLKMDKWKLLSSELKVAIEIQQIDEAGDIPYFNVVAQNLECRGMKKTSIHRALNHLVDLGNIDAKWEKVGRSWVRRFYLTGENKEYIRELNAMLHE